MSYETTLIKDNWFGVLARRKRELLLNNASKGAKMLIAVFGGASFPKDSPVLEAAYRIGFQLAQNGAMVFNGGYGGVMNASAAGAVAADVETIGVTCDNLRRSAHSEFIRNEWKVDRWDQRLLALVWLADGYIVMPGSSGTLVELSLVIETQIKGFIPGRPVVCFSDFWEQTVKRIDSAADRIKFSDSPEECVKIVTGRKSSRNHKDPD